MMKKNLKNFSPTQQTFSIVIRQQGYGDGLLWRTYSAGLQSSCKSCIQENSPPSPHPLDFGKNFYHAKTWSPMVDLYWKLVCGPIGNWSVDLSETGLWTYWKPVCRPIRNWIVDLLEARSWTYWKPVHGPIRNQFMDLRGNWFVDLCRNWFVDLLETSLWTYAETGLWTYAETGS